jgi:CheY-like chemotaxis protein
LAAIPPSLLQMFGPIESLLSDPTVRRVLVDASDAILIERHGRVERTPLAYPPGALNESLDALARRAGKPFDSQHPSLEAQLKDGTRFLALRSPAVERGPMLVIVRPGGRLTDLPGLVRQDALSEEAADALAAAMRAGLNIAVVGPADSGRTTLIEALATLSDHNRERLRDDYVAAFETCACPAIQRNLLHVAGAVRDDALLDVAARDLRTRPTIVRARYLMYLADLGRTDFLPTAWDLLTPAPSFFRLRALYTIARLDPIALPRALSQIERVDAPRFLATDDEPFCLNAIARYVRAHGSPGSTVERIADTAAAFARIHIPDFDALTTDYRKPGRNGADLIAELRSQASGRYVPAMMMSAGVREPFEAPAEEMEFVMSKPWKRTDLMDALRLMAPGPGDAEILAQADLSRVWASMT